LLKWLTYTPDTIPGEVPIRQYTEFGEDFQLRLTNGGSSRW